MCQKFVVGQAAALNEREGASHTQRAGGVGAASPDGLKLDVSHAAKKDFRILHLERSQSPADGVLGPALRVGFLRVFKEAVERFQKVGSESRSEEHTSELQHLVISYAVFCL